MFEFENRLVLQSQCNSYSENAIDHQAERAVARSLSTLPPAEHNRVWRDEELCNNGSKLAVLSTALFVQYLCSETKYATWNQGTLKLDCSWFLKWPAGVFDNCAPNVAVQGCPAGRVSQAVWRPNNGDLPPALSWSQVTSQYGSLLYCHDHR